MAGDGEGSKSVETKEEKGKGCRQKRPSHTLCSPFTDPLRKKRTMSVSDATETPPCFEPSKPLPIEDVKAVMEFCIGWKNEISDINAVEDLEHLDGGQLKILSRSVRSKG
ncbi:hypothetical protein ACE6H2_007045 [Prunus campanulata]